MASNNPNRTTIFLDEDLKKKLKIYCIEHNYTLNGFIREAVVEKLERDSHKTEGKQVVNK